MIFRLSVVYDQLDADTASRLCNAWSMKQNDIYAELDADITLLVTKKRVMLVHLVDSETLSYHPYPHAIETRVVVEIRACNLVIEERIGKFGKLVNKTLDLLLH